MPFPNSSARRKVIALHDVNHLVAGVSTGNVGEAEISAWELARGGCGKYLAAWGLDLAGMLMGFVWPIHVLRAFSTGRTMRNAYAFDADELLLVDRWVGSTVHWMPDPRRPRGRGVSLHGDPFAAHLGAHKGRGRGRLIPSTAGPIGCP